jgi:hypothetical protein
MIGCCFPFDGSLLGMAADDAPISTKVKNLFRSISHWKPIGGEPAIEKIGNAPRAMEEACV